jgi:hypothetical protein
VQTIIRTRRSIRYPPNRLNTLRGVKTYACNYCVRPFYTKTVADFKLLPLTFNLCYLLANPFSQSSQRTPAEWARFAIMVYIASGNSNPLSIRLNNNSIEAKAVFIILPSKHISQLQLHIGGCLLATHSLHIVACLSFVFSSISNSLRSLTVLHSLHFLEIGMNRRLWERVRVFISD